MPLSTGAEANEFAIKLAKMHTGRFEIVGVARAFHGATIGAASSTYLRSRRGFGPLVPGTLAVPAPYAYRCPDPALSRDVRLHVPRCRLRAGRPAVGRLAGGR